jgi:hypothetical protein
MATITTLNFAERIVLPFSVFMPILVGGVGYVIWKRDKRRGDESMTERMAMWFFASFAAIIGQCIYHVMRNVLGGGLQDYRIGMGVLGATFIIFMCLSMHLDVLQITDDDDLLLNSRHEMADFVMMTNEAVAQVGPDINDTTKGIFKRRYIAALTYLVLVFQCSFDGLALKYNPNASDSGVQVAMFFLCKLLESIVVSTALIHSCVRTKWYCLYMLNFTIAIGLSTLAAYELISPLAVIVMFEHWGFQALLGASGGLLLSLAFYYSHLESRRARIVKKNPWLMSITFSIVFSISVLTGIFG